MFKPASRECATTQSMAAMTCDTSVLPWASASLMLTIREPGAMPRNRVLSVAYVDGRRPGVAAGDDARHVRAVAEGVEVLEGRRLRLQRQVRADDQLVVRHQALDGQDARVEQRDVDALAAVAVAPERGGSGQPGHVGHVAGGAGRADAGRLQVQPAVLGDRLHGGVGAQPGHGRGRDVGDQGAERALGGDDGAAERGRGRAGGGEPALVGLDDDADARGRVRGSDVLGAGRADCQRVPRRRGEQQTPRGQRYGGSSPPAQWPIQSVRIHVSPR